MRPARRLRGLYRSAPAVVLGALFLLGSASQPAEGSELNPCGAKTLNPCAAKTLNPSATKTLNPCAAKGPNPCDAKTLNPCAAKGLNPCDAKTLNPCNAKTMDASAMNPCGAKNPCNPCAGSPVDASRFVQPAGVELAGGNQADLVARGRALWNDRSLGKSGLACANCHVDNYGQMQASFAKPYPHQVAMPLQRAAVETVNAAEMVQFCMLVPMMSDPLPWESEELAALTAFVQDIQPGYKPVVTGMNPCNPCGSKNVNPCNPCGSKNVNPCNPSNY